MDKETLNKRLVELADTAHEAKDYDAGVKVMELIGRLNGFFVERHHYTYEGVTQESAIDCLSGGDATFAAVLRRIVEAHRRRGSFQVVR